MSCSTADQTAKYISTSFIGRHDTIGDHECRRTDMVCDQADGNVVLMMYPIRFAGNPTYQVTKRTDGIYIENGIYVLDNNSQTLKTHTGINILLFQSCIIAVSVILKLGKYVVPYFHVAVAVTAYCTSRLAAAIFFSTVIVNLGTWTAWTCAVLPEVILFAKFKNTLCRNSDLFIPDIESLIILQINRRIKTAGIQTYHLSQELP